MPRTLGRIAVIVVLALVLGACATGFSPARTPPASRASPPPPVYTPPARAAQAPPVAATPQAAPATRPPQPAVTQPLREADNVVPDRTPPSTPSTGPPVAAAPPAAPPAAFGPPPPAPTPPNAAPEPAKADAKDASEAAKPPLIALVLPVKSEVYGRAAQALADGFIAAADAAHARYVLVVHADGEVLAGMDEARQEGAAVIVGPLLRDDVKAVATAGIALPPTVALNSVDEGTPLPPSMVTLALAVEGEGRQIARRVNQAGAQNVAIVTSDSPLQRRFAASFAGEWLLLGSDAPANLRFVRDPESLAILRRELTRKSFDAIVLAADGIDAASVKPYLGTTPVYASSQVRDRLSPEMARDLDGIRFVELPWLAGGEDNAFPDLPRRDWGDPTLDRLYALGHDAYALAAAIAAGKGTGFELDGATGHLVLEPNGQVAREGVPMTLQGGRPVRDTP